MATEEPNNLAQPPAAASPTLPQYPEMIMAAIEALNDRNGSNKTSISRQIEATHGNLPPSHSTLLAHHLNRMKQSGQLIMFKNNYMKPDPNAPPRRGRGRPPKPKVPLQPGTVISPPRPRGRPPKSSKDPLGPSPAPKKAPALASPVSGRKRGRPPKSDKSAPSAAAPPPSGGPRGRGRPPKVKPEVAASVGA